MRSQSIHQCDPGKSRSKRQQWQREHPVAVGSIIPLGRLVSAVSILGLFAQIGAHFCALPQSPLAPSRSKRNPLLSKKREDNFARAEERLYGSSP